MANFDNIIQEINTNLPDNNNQSITAAKLRTTLIDLTTQIDTVQDDFETDLQGEFNTLQGQVETALDNLIVDNLTSESTTKALSANQGRVLNEKIDDVSNSVSAKMDKSYPIYETSPLTASDTQYQTGYYISNTGTITATSGLGVLGFDCSEGQELFITGSFGYGKSCLGVFKNNNGNIIEKVLYKPIGSPYNNTVVSDYYCEVPSGATKIYVQTNKSLLQNPSCKLITNTTYRQYSETILQNETDIDSIQADLEQLQDDFDESIYTELTIPQTWQSNKTYTLSVGLSLIHI